MDITESEGADVGVLLSRRRRIRRRRLGAAMKWTREAFEQDRERYAAELINLEGRYHETHPLVARARRRLATVDRVLTGDLQGLIEEAPDAAAAPS